MVLQHFTLLSRPHSIDGVMVWESKHDPVVKFDLEVFMSCLLFLLISFGFYLTNNFFGVPVFVLTTVLSCLSDSVYYNHYWLDSADRISAVLSAGFLLYFCLFKWIFDLSVEEMFSRTTVLKIVVLMYCSLPSLYFINNSRCFPVRSKTWRWFHIRWHVAASVGGFLAVLCGAGWFDSFL